MALLNFAMPEYMALGKDDVVVYSRSEYSGTKGRRSL